MEYFNDVLNDRQYQYVVNKTLNGNQWELKGFSSNTDLIKFWYMELMDDPFFSKEFLARIEELTNKKYEVNRIYANGQTYGQPGNIHQDVYTDYAPELYKTFLYYVNPEWNINWGGSTQIIQPTGQVDTVIPVKNTAVLFNSTLNHFANETSRYCTEMRVTVAFKLKEII